MVPELGDPARVVRVVFGCAPGDVAERVVVTPFIPLGAFRRHVAGPVTELSPRFFYRGFSAIFEGVPVTVILAGVGPSRVGDCLGFLSLTPARTVLFVGAVGGIAPDLGIGDWFVPRETADGEGYARYVREGFGAVVGSAPVVPVPEGPRAGLLGFLRRRGLRVHEGRVYTIGSITFESPRNLGALARAGYRAIEMELSAFFAAGSRHGLEAAALTYVSDLPLRSSLWDEKPPDEETRLREAYRAAPRLALEWIAQR